MIRNKDEVTSDADSLPRLDVENDEIITDKISNNISNNNQEQSGIELSEDLQLQVTIYSLSLFLSPSPSLSHNNCFKTYYTYYKKCVHIFYVVESQFVRIFIDILFINDFLL